MPLSHERKLATGIFASCASIVLAGIFLMQATKPTPVDDIGCSAAPQSSTVVVLDRSEQIPQQTQDEILRRVSHTIDSAVEVGELVSVFTIDDLSQRQLLPRFQRCKPASDGSELYRNVSAIRRAYVTKFDEPLKASLREQFVTAQRSAIAEAIIDLSRTDYLRRKGGARLMIFSDLLQHTSAASIYGCTNPQQLITDFVAARAGATERPRFENVEVQLHTVPRTGLPPDAVTCRGRFWNWFFGDNSGVRATVVFDMLPG